MLSEQQCKQIEDVLTNEVEPRKVAAYLCLHMGLMLAEVAALRLSDIDLEQAAVVLRNTINAIGAMVPLEEVRTIPMPPHVVRYLQRYRGLYGNEDCFVLTGKSAVPQFYHMQNILTTVAARCKLGGTLSASDLRNAFIRRCIQSGMDLYSLCVYVGIKQPNVIAKRFADYFQPRLDVVADLEQFSTDYTPAPKFSLSGPKRMNLLILGAGSQGSMVKEIATAIGAFEEIAFLDDNLDNPLSMGPLSSAGKLAYHYPMAIPSFGDSCLRKKWMDQLEESGFIVPTLIHPTAMVSPSAKVERSVVVEARSIVSSGAVVGRGTLVSSGSIIEPSAQVGCFAHVGSAVTVARNAAIEDYIRVPSGTVIRAELLSYDALG